MTQTHGEPTAAGFRLVVYLYAFLCIALGLLMVLVQRTAGTETQAAKRRDAKRNNVLADLKTLAAIPELWLMAAIVFCGYQMFWATYSFSAYLQRRDRMTVVMAGTITTLKLWMRPIGGIGGGYLGDRFSKLGVVTALFLAALALVGPDRCAAHLEPRAAGVALVLFIGILTYAIRGLYWSLLDQCGIPFASPASRSA